MSNEEINKQNRMLLLALQKADEKAKQQIISEIVTLNLPMAKRIVSRLYPTAKTQNFEDYVQDSIFGLLNAINHYKPGRAEFGTYAFACMRRSILARNKKRSISCKSFIIETCEDDSPIDLLDRLEDPVDYIELYEDKEEKNVNINRLKEYIRYLGPSERKVLEMKYLSNQNRGNIDIAKALNVSIQNVNSAQKRAIALLKNMVNLDLKLAQIYDGDYKLNVGSLPPKLKYKILQGTKCKKLDIEIIKKCINTSLTLSQRIVIDKRYFSSDLHSMDEISANLDIDKNVIKLNEKIAVQKMKQACHIEQ